MYISSNVNIVQGFAAGVQFTDMQAHSLKPSGGTDMQFNITKNQIQGFGDAEGHCVAARHLHVRFSLSSIIFWVQFHLAALYDTIHHYIQVRYRSRYSNKLSQLKQRNFKLLT